MKLLKHAGLLLSLVTLSFFTNCSSDDDVVNNIEKDYFTIEEASYIDNNLPSGTAQLISDLNIANHVINGGSTLINFSSTEKLKSLNVAVKGVNGYYEVKLPEATPKSETAESTYEYQVVLMINQNIAVENFKLALSATSIDGQVSPVSESKDISVIEAGTGKLQVTLSWDQDDDLDLHVMTPDEEEISYKNNIIFKDQDKFYFNFHVYLINKYTDHDTSGLNYDNEDDLNTLDEYIEEFENDDENQSILWSELEEYIKDNKDQIAAYLDIDSNAACDIDGINNENIFFNEVQNGEYIIAVDLYSKCDDNRAGAKYSVTLNYGGRTIKFSDDQIGQFDKDNKGSGDVSSKYVIIGKFTVSDAKSTVVKATTKENNPSREKFNKYFSKKK